jgi:hypothetical protein
VEILPLHTKHKEFLENLRILIRSTQATTEQSVTKENVSTNLETRSYIHACIYIYIMVIQAIMTNFHTTLM